MAAPSPTTLRVFTILAVAVIAVSLSAIFIRMADAPGIVVAFYRMLFASLLLAPVTLPALRKAKFTARSFIYTALAGVFLAIHFATWITSLSYTTVAASVTLTTSTPLWMALFSWLFLGRPPPLAMLMGVLLAVAGGAMIGFGDLAGGSRPLLGDSLALLGAISVTFYFLLGRSAQRLGLGLGAYAGGAYAVAALVLLPVPALFGYSYLAYPTEVFLWIGLLAAVPQLVGHTGINYAMKYIDPTLVATIILLEPVFAALLALLVFAEVPGTLTLLGAAVLLTGVAVTSRTGAARPPDPEPTT